MITHLVEAFDYKSLDMQPKHNCCDNCIKVCQCEECPSFVGLSVPEDVSEVKDSGNTRPVTAQQKDHLRSELLLFRNNLIQNHSSEMQNTVMMEFGNIQIQQVINNCHKLFTLEDVKKCVEVWRNNHAHGILRAVSVVFGLDHEIPEIIDDTQEILADIDWGDLRDDSTMLSMIQSQELEFMDSDQASASGGGSQNSTGFLQSLISMEH